MNFPSVSDTDTDFSESEALSSLQISGPAKLEGNRKEFTQFSNQMIRKIDHKTLIVFFLLLEPQVHRIETKQAPVPSQPEVVLSDGKNDGHFVDTQFFNCLVVVGWMHTFRALENVELRKKTTIDF